MSSVRRTGAVAATFLMASGLLATACSDLDDGAGCFEGKCDSAEDVRSQLDGLDDAIAVWLRESDMTRDGKIDTDYMEVVEQVARVMGCGMDTMKTFIVSDDLVMGTPFPRLISTVCTNDETRAADFFIAASFDDPDSPDDVDVKNLEMFAWDTGRREYVFYATLPIEGEPDLVQMEVSPRRCTGCHLNSRSLDDDGMPMLPIMNELSSPWPHWSAEPDFPSHTFEVADRTRQAKNFKELTSGTRLGAAPMIEQFIRASVANRIIPNRLRTRRDPADVGQAMALLRPLFCDEQVNYVTEDHGSNVLPASAVVAGGIRDAYLAIRPSDWPWQWLNNNVMRFQTGSTAPLSMIPVRGNADVEYEKRLVAVRALTPEQILRIRALDWATPVFSKLRCGLWQDARARLRKDPPAIRPGMTNADLMPVLYDEIMTLDGQSLIGPAGKLAALESATGRAELVDALSSGALPTDCAGGLCEVDLMGFGNLLDAAVRASEASRSKLAAERDARLCVVDEDFPSRPAFQTSCRGTKDFDPLSSPAGGRFGLESSTGEPFFFQGVSRDVHLVPDGRPEGVTSTIVTTQGALNLPADFVTVRLAIQHRWRGDLAVEITTPNGLVVPVVAFPPDDSGDDVDQLFNVVVPVNMRSEGAWTLRVIDRAAGEQGFLEGWSIGVNAVAPTLEAPGARLPPGSF
jgi:subtilisin-like proprotein convertase family protein